MKNLFLSFVLILISSFSFAQDTTTGSGQYVDKKVLDNPIKRFSIGIKVGAPNILSGGVQYTLPILNNHFAPYFDYSGYALKTSDVDSDMKFLEYGATYYFNQSGKGFYLGLGISQLNVKANYKDISLDMRRSGSGKTEIDLNTTNLKLGVKTGGRVYFRIEMGYGIGNLPQSVTFVATDNSNPFYTETTTEEIPSIPGVSENGMIIGNIGLGVSF